MKLRITQDILKKHKKLLLGALIVKDLNNSRRISAIQKLIRGAAATKQKDIKKAVLWERKSIASWKDIQKEPSHIEKTLKDLQDGVIGVGCTAIEDVLVYYTIKGEISIHAIDLDEVCGDLEIKKATGNEPFRPKGTHRLEHPENDEIVYADKAGVTSRYWNSSPCERTSLTPESHNVLILIESMGIFDHAKMKRFIMEMSDTIKKYFTTTVDIHLLGDHVSEVDLGVTGRTGISDNDFKPDIRRIQFHRHALELEKKRSQKNLVTGKSIQQEPVAQPEKNKAQVVALKQRSDKNQPLQSSSTQPGTESHSTEQFVKGGGSASGKSTFLQQKGVDSPKSAKKNEPLPLKVAELDIDKEVAKMIEKAIQKAFPELKEKPKYEIDHPREMSHGDYACNVALVLAKTLGSPPLEIAQKITDCIEKTKSLESVEVAPPGFINCTLSEQWLEGELKKILGQKSPYNKLKAPTKKPIIIEYSQPNIAKPLGVHHLLSTIIGQSLSNLYRYLGYKTISINHIGDWGTQFGKLTVAYQKWGDEATIKKNPIEELLKIYIKFHEEAEKNPLLENEARTAFKKLEEGDKEVRALWKFFVEESLKDVQTTYDLLNGIEFDYVQGESFYQDKMEEVLKEGVRKKVFKEGEGGALVVEFEDDSMPTCVVQKSDGASIYMTRDIAAINYRLKKWNPEKIIYVVDVAQQLYFRQLFETAGMLGWPSDNLVHAIVGRMSFGDKSMSTRKGNIVRLNKVLEEAKKRAATLIEEKSGHFSEQEKQELARQVGIGAVKHAIVSQNRTTNIIFDWDKMLSLDGNSAPYLQYTNARAQSILRKAKDEPFKRELPSDNFQVSIFDQEETRNETEAGEAEGLYDQILTRVLTRFPEALLKAAQEYRPHIVCNALYEIAQLFNKFYQASPVLRAETKELRVQRLKLVEATSIVLKNGLEILGIESPKQM